MLGLNTLSLFILSSNVNCYVEQNPNVAFDFDHWEDCDEDKEDSHFAKVRGGAPTPQENRRT